jgi:hypothetical protein
MWSILGGEVAVLICCTLPAAVLNFRITTAYDLTGPPACFVSRGTSAWTVGFTECPLSSTGALLVRDEAAAEHVVTETIATAPAGANADFLRRAVVMRCRSLLRPGGRT